MEDHPGGPKRKSFMGRLYPYKEQMFEKTNTPEAPWEIIDANRKTEARLKTIEYILDQIPHQNKSVR